MGEIIVENDVYFPLKGRASEEGYYAIVSIDKWSAVSKFKWYLGKDGYPHTYGKRGGIITLHKFVKYMDGIESNKELFIDHINGDKLDNRDSNLRMVTPQQNTWNREAKGVRKTATGYAARVVKDGKSHEINDLPDENTAKEVYKMMTEELFGEFARIRID